MQDKRTDRGATRVRFTARGHPSITATHDKTLEITRDPIVTRRGTCIVGTQSTHVSEQLRTLRGVVEVKMTVTAGAKSLSECFRAEISPFFLDDDSLVFRRGPNLRQRTFAGLATASAQDLDRNFVALLREPASILEVTMVSTGVRGPGVLWVVSTPIGNDDDLSLRARSVLGSVDCVLAEDTRRLRNLAARVGFRCASVESFNLVNEAQSVDSILARLLDGARLALVSDAGTPLLSDPGYPLVRAAIECEIPVVPVPGPSALLAALVSSGLPPTPLWFEGYPPRSRAQRLRRIAELARMPATTAMLESPRRISNLLADIESVDPAREVCLARELTKIHEEVLRGTAGEVSEALGSRFETLGEIVILMAPPNKTSDPGETLAPQAGFVRSLLADNVPLPTIVRALQASTGMPRNEAYDLVLSLRRSATD